MAVPVSSPATVAATLPGLVISQLKVTSNNGQFVTLYNTTDQPLDMSKYQLEYFNNYDVSKATSSKLVSLSGVVPAHGYFMASDSSLLLCYQLTVDSVSLGFSATAGLLEVVSDAQAAPGGSVVPALQDYVAWSKSAVSSAQTLPSDPNAFLERQPAGVSSLPSVASPGDGTWLPVVPDGTNQCSLLGSASGDSPGAPGAAGLNQLLPSVQPPFKIISVADGSTAQNAPTLPAVDIGLMAPSVTELLPNPAGTGTDATDEFIELYNPNPAAFDLSGFSLQSGTTTLHHFSFPAGASLPAKGFKAFYAADTALSMSNSGGQVKFLDPFGNPISSSDVYGTAKDGMAWALAGGKWYWTTVPTPGAANVVNQSSAAKSATKQSKTKSAGTAKPATAAATLAASNTAAADQALTTPVHPWTLALVVSLALLYGAYEYRADLANRYYQLRRHFARRRGNRTAPARGRGD